MASKIPKIHDKFIKELLSDREVAIDFLQELLPKELLQHIKPETLVQEQTSYLSTDLEETFSDIVWRIETQAKPLKICLLLEHKSYKDPNVVFQLLEYLAQGYRQQLKSNSKYIEPIVPVLYYHGKVKWELRFLEDFFDDFPSDLKKYIPTFQPEFIDLNRLSTEQLLKLRNGMLASSLLIQRHYFDNEKLVANIGHIFEALSPYLEKNLSTSIFVYLIQFLELDKVKLTENLKEIPQHLNTKIMSLYDQLIQEGRAKGLAEGIEQGIEKGIEKTILNSFDNAIDLKTIRLITGESIEKIEAILKQNGRLK